MDDTIFVDGVEYARVKPPEPAVRCGDIVKVTEVALAQTEDAKKKESLSQEQLTTNSTPGPPEDSQTTAPAAATST